jgi:hypothetical protein
MSSIFEAPPDGPRSRIPSSLPQIAAAFAAGIVVAVAVARPGVSPDSQRTPAALQTAAPTTTPDAAASAKPNKLAESAAASRPASEPTRPAEPSPTVRVESQTTDAAKQATACNRQWPYLEKDCREPDTNSGERQKSIRVIGVDQTAPSTVVAESKPQAEPQPVQPTAAAGNTTAAAVPPAPTAAPTGNDSTGATGHSGTPTTTALAAPEPPKSGEPSAQSIPANALPAPEQAPVPARDPRTKAKADTSRPAKPRAVARRERTRPDTAQRGATASETVEREVTTSDRVSSRKAERLERRNAQPRRDDVEERNEADGFSLVRSHTLPDGRRVTVYRKYDSEAFSERRPAYRRSFGPAYEGMDDPDD